MPAYISHAIMGEELYKKLKTDKKNVKLPISKDKLKGYSLGVDLSELSKKTTSDPQNYHTREYFIKMIKYIKENNLVENEEVISLLYGHIAHYFLDINTHPFIYYIESKCQKIGFISPHNLIEGYLSSYLSKKILGKDIMEIKPNYFNKIDLSNPEISRMLNTIYGEIYGDYKIIKSYKITLKIFSHIESIIKSGIISKERLIKISNFIKFLEKNNLTTRDLINENHNTYKDPITGKKHTESFMELYQKSIEENIEAIYIVNKYLYSNGNIDSLKSVFTDLSYDTGTPCKNKKTYTRKKK